MKTAVIVVLALAAGALAAPPYQATPYRAPYNQDYYKNDYKQSYNYDSSYDNSYQPNYGYQTPSYNDYSQSSYSYNQPSYNNDFQSSYNQPSYNQPGYSNDYKSSYNQPSYNQPSYDSYSPSNYGYSQPDYSQKTYGYQSNYYQQKSCAPLNSIKPAKPWLDVVKYVAGPDVTVAYCGATQASNVNVFYVRSGDKCAVINKRSQAGLEEKLTFYCNHQTGYWDLLSGSDTKTTAISQYNIICGSQGDYVQGCGAPNTANTGDDLSVFYPYKIGSY